LKQEITNSKETLRYTKEEKREKIAQERQKGNVEKRNVG
jgi:hypothetical protein